MLSDDVVKFGERHLRSVIKYPLCAQSLTRIRASLLGVIRSAASVLKKHKRYSGILIILMSARIDMSSTAQWVGLTGDSIH